MRDRDGFGRGDGGGAVTVVVGSVGLTTIGVGPAAVGTPLRRPSSTVTSDVAPATRTIGPPCSLVRFNTFVFINVRRY